MSILGKIRDKVGQHSEQIERGVEKGARLVDDKTGHRYTDRIRKGRDLVERRLHEERRDRGAG
jgi:hypothetical protein